MSTDPVLLDFPTWLKRRRGALGWTQANLADEVSCALVTVKRIEAGSLVPSVQLADLMASKLGVPNGQRLAFTAFARDAQATVAEMAFWPSPAAAMEPSPHLLSLPALLTATIGREREIRAAVQLLHRDDVRLVTLTGPPGTGKTRLSIAIAHALQADFADGLCFVPLAPVRDEAAVIPAIAQALALPEGRGISPVETVRRYLAGKQFLLVLDNFEQVVAAAPRLTDLLAQTPGLKILISSREWLNCYGEHEFPVPPLTIPDVYHLPPLEALSGYSAIDLFVSRAQAVNPHFVLDANNGPAIAQICAWLDGLPLAIEMASARVRRFTPTQLLSQLTSRLQTLVDGPRNLSPRQQTLRGAIDWSYDLLRDEEKSLLAHASLFVEGTTEDLAAIWPNSVDMATVQNMVYALADKSLLRLNATGEPPRFHMLETLREYGLERLQVWGIFAAAQERFALYFLQRVEALAPRLQEGAEQQLATLAVMDQEYANYLTALNWATSAAADETIGLRFCLALYTYWETRGYYGEAIRRQLAVLARATTPATIRATLLANTSQMLRWTGDPDKALALLTEAIALCEQLGDEVGLATALHHLGQHYGHSFEYGNAAAQFRRSLEIYRRLDKQAAVAKVLGSLGLALMRQALYDEAEAAYREALHIRQQLNDQHGQSHGFHGLGQCAFARKDLEQAETMLREALRLRWRWGHRRHLTNTLDLLGKVYIEKGCVPDGVRLLGLTEKMLREMDLQMPNRDPDRYMTTAQSVLGPEMMAQHLAEGGNMSLAQGLGLLGMEGEA